jgi:amidase
MGVADMTMSLEGRGTDQRHGFPADAECESRASLSYGQPMTDDLARLDAVALAELVRTGRASPGELVDATIARIEQLDPEVNAVIHPLFEKARSLAADELPDGPFRGVPMLLKDLWPASEGDPWHQGVRGLKEAGYTADRDANLTTAYRRAGFVICGRTNTPELGLLATTEPLAHGPSRNPWDTSRGTGGSSGGAAAAVAAGMVPAANASDGGGSIRIPAAMCGLVGLKPSRGRVSMGPDQDEWGNSVQHVVCHTVRDSAAILDATASPFPGDGVIAPTSGQPYLHQVGRPTRQLRIGMLDTSANTGIDLPSDIADAVRDAGTRLERLGHHVDVSHPPVLDDESLVAEFAALWMVGAAAALDRVSVWLGRPVGREDVEPATWAMAEAGRGVTGPDVMRMLATQTTYRREMAAWWADGHDLLLTATSMRTAPRLGDLVATEDDPLRALTSSIPYAINTAPFNTTGQPAISLPLARSDDGLPIGIQLVAGYGREDILFQVAGQLEAEVAWAERRAPLHP